MAVFSCGAGGSQHFPRVLAEWVALTGPKEHEDFLLELPGLFVGNCSKMFCLAHFGMFWILLLKLFQKLRLAKLSTPASQQEFVASCLIEDLTGSFVQLLILVPCIH